MKFKEWFPLFFDAYVDESVCYVASYEYNIIYKKHFESLTNMELNDIRPINIKQIMKGVSQYGVSRQRKTYNLLNKCFNAAIDNDYMIKNPVSSIKRPKKVAKDPQVFSPQQLEKLFDEVNSTSRMFLLELWTGLRRGELLALHWDNIDLEAKIIHVCQTFVLTKDGEQIKKTTKSKRDRIIPISNTVLQILIDIKKYDSATGFLFKSPINKDKPIALHTYHDRYQAYFKRQHEKHPDLIYLTPHKLRHTFATFSVVSGTDIDTLRALLGHSSIKTTEIYIHTNIELMKKATENLRFEY